MKIYWCKAEDIKIDKVVNPIPLKPIKKEKKFVYLFKNRPYIEKIVDDFRKSQIKDALRKQIECFGFNPKSIMLHFANGVEEHTKELAEEAYNELLNEFGVKLL